MSTTHIGWEHLHDATLVALTTEWASGATRVRVRLSEEPGREAELQVSAATLVHCPRQHPWGPSVSINEVRVSPLEGGRKRIEIEVQSGDVIELQGDAVEVVLVG